MRKGIVIMALMKTLVLHAEPPVRPPSVRVLPPQPGPGVVPGITVPPPNLGQLGSRLPGQLPLPLGNSESPPASPSTNTNLPSPSEFRAAIPPSAANAARTSASQSPPPTNYDDLPNARVVRLTSPTGGGILVVNGSNIRPKTAKGGVIEPKHPDVKIERTSIPTVAAVDFDRESPLGRVMTSVVQDAKSASELHRLIADRMIGDQSIDDIYKKFDEVAKVLNGGTEEDDVLRWRTLKDFADGCGMSQGGDCRWVSAVTFEIVREYWRLNPSAFDEIMIVGARVGHVSEGENIANATAVNHFFTAVLINGECRIIDPMFAEFHNMRLEMRWDSASNGYTIYGMNRNITVAGSFNAPDPTPPPGTHSFINGFAPTSVNLLEIAE